MSTGSPDNLTRMKHAVMKAVGKGADVIANKVCRNVDAEGACLTHESAMPDRGVAGLGQVEVGRRRRARCGGSGTEAVRALWAGNSVGKIGLRVDRDLRSIVTAVCVGVHAMWVLLLVAVVVWKRGGWMR